MEDIMSKSSTAGSKKHSKHVIAYRPLRRRYEAPADHDDGAAKEATLIFSDFVDVYLSDMKNRWKPSTAYKKESMIRARLIPSFGKCRLNAITPVDIRRWQADMIDAKTEKGKPYSRSYIRQLQAELACIFNYAVKFYSLPENPCTKAGTVSISGDHKMQFWTVDEFTRFIEALDGRPAAHTAFMLLYYTGIREGELLALTPADINLSSRTMSISKTYQRIRREDVITSPKTSRSNRVVTLPESLCSCIEEYLGAQGPFDPCERIFPYTKDYLYREMKRGCEASGVKRIRIHDLRHSHASLLVEMGFSPLLIAERLGHEKVQTTMNIYSHLYPNKQGEVAAQLNGVMLDRQPIAAGTGSRR